MISALYVIDNDIKLGPGWKHRAHTDHYVYVGEGDVGHVCETRKTAGISGLSEAGGTGDLQEPNVPGCVVLPVAGERR